MKFSISKPRISREEFLQLLTEQFPAITPELQDEDYQGLIHLQVACLTRYANHCLAIRRLDEFRRVIDFFHQTIEKVDATTENALYVSFLEHLEMDGDNQIAKEAQRLLKPEYLKIWESLRR
jgi:hypothetical protein